MKNDIIGSNNPSARVKLTLMTITLVMLTACGQSRHDFESTTSSIYGRDDRIEVYQSPNPQLKRFARSVVTLVKASDISGNTISTKSYGEKYNMCETERFIDQPTPAYCSGFLAANDIIVTAGHCIKNTSDCAKARLLFDVGYMVNGNSLLSVNTTTEQNTFRCKKILRRIKDPETKMDFAVIRLDRPVSDRIPLKFRASGTISSSDKVALIGNPAGLPLKIASDAKIVANSNSIFFETNVDSFGGNSGSPIFNLRSGEVEGILVRGKSDFNLDGDCTTSNIYDENTTDGEDVTRSINFARFITDRELPDPAPQPRPTPTSPDRNYKLIQRQSYSMAGAAESIGNLHRTSLHREAKALHFAASDLYRSARSSATSRQSRHNRADQRHRAAVNRDFAVVRRTYNTLYRKYNRSHDRGISRYMETIIDSYRTIKHELR